MTISKVFGTCMLLGLIAVTALCLNPSIVLAEGGEPHNCAGLDAFDPPPYMGNVTVDYDTSCDPHPSGCAFITGTVVQAGTGVSIDLVEVFYESAVTPDQFSSHTARDIRGRCIEGEILGGGLGNFQIIAAHGLEYESDIRFTVDIVLMPLTTR